MIHSHPAASRPQQLATLILICLLTLGVYFAFDNPAALAHQFTALAGGSNVKYELLYSLYALPNLVLPLASGVLTDKLLGLHTSIVFLAAFVLCGQLTVTAGVGIGAFPVVAAGRLLMGLGGETLYALQPALCAWWFSKSLQPAAMATALTLGAVGETLNFLITPTVARAAGIDAAMALSSAMCLVSLAAALALGGAARRHRLAAGDGRGASLIDDPGSIDGEATGAAPMRSASGRIGVLRGLADPPALVLCTVNMLVGAPFYTFPSLARLFFERQWGPALRPSASTLLALYYLIPILLAGPLGIYLGGASVASLHRWLVLGCALMAAGFAAMATVSAIHPLIGLVVIGVGYTLLCSTLPPALAARYPLRLHGQAFGMWASAQNLANFVAPEIAGWLADRHSVTAAVGFCGSCCAAGAFVGAVLTCVVHDRRQLMCHAAG